MLLSQIFSKGSDRIVLTKYRQGISAARLIEIGTPPAHTFARKLQTFGDGSEDNSWEAKLKRNKSLVQIVWFGVTLSAVLITAMNAQKHRYQFSNENMGTSKVMSSGELAAMKSNKGSRLKLGGVKKSDVKPGIDGMMEDLYSEKVAGRQFEDWENIRNPRSEEPETIEAHEMKKIALFSQKPELETSEFTSEDYGKIEEADIMLDFQMQDEED